MNDLMELETHYCLSKNKKRNKIYTAFLESCRNGVTVGDIARIGYKLMRKEKLHHHFFGDYSLLTTSLYLTFFSLQLPYEYNNEKYLSVKITEKDAVKIIALFERIISERIPVEYITNESYYLGNKFYVNENVLVPRSIMNTRFNDFLNEVNWENNRVLDLCTGTGCIGITLALLNPKIKVDLVDISAKALEVALINVNNYSLNNRISCIQSDLFDNIQEKYDLIITNPPYVSVREYEASPDEFKKEPKIALDGGIDGLDIINKILVQAKKYLNSNGIIIAEVGCSAAKLLKKKYPDVPFRWLKYRKPTGSESIFGMHGIFLCKANQLPDPLVYEKLL